MQRIPDSPPTIALLPSAIVRPYWSVMIPAYNCSVFLPDAIKSVLNQAPNEELMQIEVVDDCSTDANVEALVKEIGKGRVSYFRQEKNVGSLRNFETCINRAKGYHIHLLHGDDRVKWGFYTCLSNLFKQFPEAGAAYCAYNYIDIEALFSRPFPLLQRKAGIVENFLSKLAEKQLMQYVAVVVKREVYEKLGGFYGVIYGEDWEMWARISKHYPVAYTPEMLAEYREHSDSISGNSYLSGKNIEDFKNVYKIINGYLPEREQKKAARLAFKNYTYWALGTTLNLWRTTHNKEIVYNQLKKILKLYIDLKVLKMTSTILLRIQLQPLKDLLMQGNLNKSGKNLLSNKPH